nr:hypothetical protein [Tropicibacter naphthalenivorans]
MTQAFHGGAQMKLQTIAVWHDFQPASQRFGRLFGLTHRQIGHAKVLPGFCLIRAQARRPLKYARGVLPGGKQSGPKQLPRIVTIGKPFQKPHRLLNDDIMRALIVQPPELLNDLLRGHLRRHKGLGKIVCFLLGARLSCHGKSSCVDHHVLFVPRGV